MKNAFEEGSALLCTKTELFAALTQDHENQSHARNLKQLPQFFQRKKENLQKQQQQQVSLNQGSSNNNKDTLAFDRLITKANIQRIRLLMAGSNGVNDNNNSEILKIISQWFSEMEITRLLPSRRDGDEGCLILECMSKLQNSRVKFYMRLKLRRMIDLQNCCSEQEAFQLVSSNSAVFLSMKYQKVISEHVLIAEESIENMGNFNEQRTFEDQPKEKSIQSTKYDQNMKFPESQNISKIMNTTEVNYVVDQEQPNTKKFQLNSDINSQQQILKQNNMISNDTYFVEIILLEFCQFSLREIISSGRKDNSANVSSSKREDLSNNSKKPNHSNSNLSNNLNITSNTASESNATSNNNLISKFLFQYLQRDLVETIFFMHSRGCTHNNISLDSIFYDKYINAFVIGGFGSIQTKVREYSSFRKDIIEIGRILMHFLIAQSSSNCMLAADEDYVDKIDQIESMSEIELNELAQQITNSNISPLKRQFILLNMNLYEQRMIIQDIFPSGQQPSLPFDIVELAISLNLQSCLASKDHQLISAFLNNNQVDSSSSMQDILKDPLDSSVSLWTYTGKYKDGLFDGEGEIKFLNKVIFKGVWETGLNPKYLSPVSSRMFLESYNLCNLMKINMHNGHQELSFSVQEESNLLQVAKMQKTLDLQFSDEKGQIIDSLNVIMKYFQIPLSRIAFDLKKPSTTRGAKSDCQVIEMKGQPQQIQTGRNINSNNNSDVNRSSLLVMFGKSYPIREEEFYIILEKACLWESVQLVMSHSQIGDKLLYGMSFNPKLRNLCELDISHSTLITDEGIVSFVQNCPANSLRTLDLSYTQVSDQSLLELAVSTKLTQLMNLNLAHCMRLTENAVIQFIKSANSLTIQHLNLSFLNISDVFVDILGISPFMKHITSIILNDCHQISFRIFETLSKSDTINCIHRLELSNCLRHSQTPSTKKTGFLDGLLDKRKGKIDFKSFTKTDKLAQLLVLNLQGCQVSYHHIKQLASSHSLKNVEHLNISFCENLTDECIKELCSSANFSKLKILNLNGIKNLTILSMESIGHSKLLVNLEKLHVSGCEHIDKSALLLILTYANFQRLSSLEFDENQYSLELIRSISFSNRNNIQTFHKLQLLELHLLHPEQFFKVNMSELLISNQKPIKFIVATSQEGSVLEKLAAILSRHYFNVKECCEVSVNMVPVNDRLVEEFKNERNSRVSTSSLSNADILAPALIKQDQQSTRSFTSIEKQLQKQEKTTSFMEMNTYCKTECFKAMGYVNFLDDLRKLDLSTSVSINLAGFQFIKECSFFSRVIELNLGSLQISNKHIVQLCSGQQFSNLRILSLADCSNISFEGFQVFLKAGAADTLQYLDVLGSSIEGTAFVFSLPSMKQLTQLNQGKINIDLCRSDMSDEEEGKQRLKEVFEKIQKFFYICELKLKTNRVRATSQILEGMTFIFTNHSNTITNLDIAMLKAHNMSSEQSINFWSGVSGLSKLKSLNLEFEQCKTFDKMFLRNMFFGISVLDLLEELKLSLPSTQILIEPEDCAPLCDLMTRLQSIQFLQINFSQMPCSNSQFLEEFNGIIGKLENMKYLSLNYSKNVSCPENTFIKLLESLESSKARLYFLNLDFGMCSMGEPTWKRLKKYIYSQSLLRELSLDISYCLELKDSSVVKMIQKCLELKMLKTLRFNFAGVTKISHKAKEILKANAGIYLLETFDFFVQEAS